MPGPADDEDRGRLRPGRGRRGGRGRRRRAERRGRRAPRARAGERPRSRRGRSRAGTGTGHRLPDLSVAAAAARRDRLLRVAARAPGRPGTARPSPVGRHAGLVAGPARRQDRTSPRPCAQRRPGSGSSGSRATPRSATASPRSSGPGWATRPRSPSSSRAPRSPTSGASSSPTRRPPGSRRSPRGGAAGPGSSSPASRRSSSTRSRRRPAGRRRVGSGPGARLPQDALLRDLFDLGYEPVPEVAGRGEFARRGGIVDVFPPSLPLPDPDRVLRRRDRFAARLRPDRPADGRAGRARPCSCRRPSSCCPAGGAAAIRERLGRARRPPARAAGRGPRAVRGRPARRRVGATGRDRAARPRAMTMGDAAEVWAALLAPATGLDHLGPARCSSSTSRATSRRRPSSCGARPTSVAPS